MPNPFAPRFDAVTITPNPALLGEQITIAIAVVDAEIIPQVVAPYSGEIYAGEEAML